MPIKIFDSLSQTKKALDSKGKIKIYVCGPTVYDDMHLGHARTYLSFDIILKFLRSQKVKAFYLQNITDIDDKIITRATQKKTTSKKIADQFLKKYLTTSKKIGIDSVDKYIKASAVIPEIKEIIKSLEDKGLTYQTDNGVYFRVKQFARYGQLSKQNIDELRQGHRIEPDPQKEDPLDFALWKKQKKPSEPAWPSPWGKGRPGWHIECSSIINKFLGSQIDIHGGGMDLKFPHHESEIAQAESFSGQKPFVKIWMHTGFLLVEGEKMSKSLHNFITVDDFLKNYSPQVLRWMVFSRHYRSPFDFKEEEAIQSVNSLLSIKMFLANLKNITAKGTVSKQVKSHALKLEKEIQQAMSDDFNTPQASSALFEFINFANSLNSINKSEASLISKTLTKILDSFGFQFSFKPIPQNVKELVEKREIFRTVRNFEQSDKLRDKLKEIGYKVGDTDRGPIIVHNDFEQKYA